MRSQPNQIYWLNFDLSCYLVNPEPIPDFGSESHIFEHKDKGFDFLNRIRILYALMAYVGVFLDPSAGCLVGT